MRIVTSIAAILLLAAAAALADDADEARDTFNSLFAKDLEAVQGTGAKTDDVALAARLVETAGKSTGEPAFLSLLCEHACRLASGHPSGYATAIRAMDLLAEHVPEKAAEARQRLLDLRRKQFEAARGEARQAAGEALLDALLALAETKQEGGDTTGAAALYREARTVAKAAGSNRLPEIEAAAEDLARRIRLASRVADVKAILARDPGNVGAREGLVRLYLVNLNDPAKAAEVLEGVEDSGLKKYVPAAAKPVDEAPELACLELGEWYRGLTEKAPDYAKAAMYARAKAYLARFLSLHETKDLHRVRAKVAMEKVDEAIAKWEAAATAKAQPTKPTKPTETAGGIEGGVIKPGQWVDLLPLVDPEKDAVKGEWKRRDGGLAVQSPGRNRWRIELPVAARSSYQVQFRFTRHRGNDGIFFQLPVGSSHVALALSHWNGGAHGLDLIDGDNPHENATGVKPGRLENGRPHTLDVQVKVRGQACDIAARLDGSRLLQWSGDVSSLSVWGEFGLPHPHCFGLNVTDVDVTFASARLKMLSGEARLLRPGATAKASEPATVPTGSAIRAGQWVDLLSLVDPQKDAVKGEWKKRDRCLFIDQTPAWACIKVPVVTESSYELDVRFVRTSGDESLGVFLPVGSSRVLLEFSVLKGKAGGLNVIAGKPAPENEAAVKPCTLENGREYAVRVQTRVRGETAEIAVTLDGRPWTSWQGRHSSLSVFHDWGMPQPKTFGFSAWCVGVSFRSARLKMLSGEARVLSQQE